VDWQLAAQIEAEALYASYTERQAAEVRALQQERATRLPDSLDYTTVPGLSNEARQKLMTIRPSTIGDAGQIDGITPQPWHCWSLLYASRLLLRNWLASRDALPARRFGTKHAARSSGMLECFT
jgi:hypothetical protein